MSVRWRYLDADGADAGASEPFESREHAEAWLVTGWEDLADAGVDTVALVDDGAELYRMSLGADGQPT